MTRQGTGDVSMDSPWPSIGAAAGPATAPVAAAARSVLTAGSIATVAATILIFVVIAAGVVTFQYFFDVWDRPGSDRHGARASRRRGGRAAGGGGGIRAARGVDPDVLGSLPVTVYRKAAPGSSSSEEEDAAECAVCLAELEDGEEARYLPRCGHGFHAACVDTWLASHTTCPLCRLTIAKPDASPAPALALRPVPPEPANYAANLPASVLLGVSDQRAVTVASDADTTASTGSTVVLVIEIPESPVPAPTPRHAARSQAGSARPRSFRRLWSFGRQGAGPSSSCSCGGAGEGDDVEQGGARQPRDLLEKAKSHLNALDGSKAPTQAF
ncbi:E3 ubiquitin-protein ligase EL5-like [Panicum virgatum]|nr:E3 ubiquitin-protein ligase EL5-like [Panicum virgatum]